MKNNEIVIKKEIIGMKNSIFTICKKYFGNYDYLAEILSDNNLDIVLPNRGTEISIYLDSEGNKIKNPNILTSTTKPKDKTIILLCGQFSSGTTSYSNMIIKKFSKLKIDCVDIEAIVDDKTIANYIIKYKSKDDRKIRDEIIKTLFKDQDLIIINSESISKNSREYLINIINNKLFNINLITIFLRPNVDEILKRHIFRCNNLTFNDIDVFKRILNAYDATEIPTEEEFANFNLKSSKLFIIDNSAPIENIDLKYLNKYLKDLKNGKQK